MKKGIIYRAWSPSSKSYIGQTIQTFQTRKNKHKYAALEAKTKYPFYNAIRYYGWSKIKWEILHSNVPADQLNALETIEVKNYDALSRGYNCTAGGCGQLERKISEQTRERMIRNHWARNKNKREQTIKKMSRSLKGREVWCTGKKKPPLSTETKRKISESLRGDKNPNKKLRLEQVKKIRNLFATGKYKQVDLAKQYSVSKTCIRLIVTNQTWYEDWKGIQLNEDIQEEK